MRERFLSALSLLCVFAALLRLSGEVRAEELRDPFMFGPRGEAAVESGPTLVGVLWDPTHPLAIVGEQTLAVGDAIAEWQVVEIQQDGIVVQRADRREFIPLGTPLPNE